MPQLLGAAAQLYSCCVGRLVVCPAQPPTGPVALVLSVLLLVVGDGLQVGARTATRLCCISGEHSRRNLCCMPNPGCPVCSGDTTATTTVQARKTQQVTVLYICTHEYLCPKGWHPPRSTIAHGTGSCRSGSRKCQQQQYRLQHEHLCLTTRFQTCHAAPKCEGDHSGTCAGDAQARVSGSTGRARLICRISDGWLAAGTTRRVHGAWSRLTQAT